MSRHGTHQHRPPAGPILAALLACLLFLPINAAAAEPVGRVLVATGSVTAEQKEASARSLGRRDPIYAGDRIRTAARARVQIRFEDGAMVDLDPSSTFEVEQYTSDEDGGGSAVMNFLKGAMRTITGAIGSNRGDDYRMNTTVATIGVRGTAYALEYCDAECAGEDGQTGLFGRVEDGEVEVNGPGGTGGFSEGQYFFVPDGGAPARIVAPPEGILEGEGETGADGDDDRIEDVSIRPLNTGEEDSIGLGGNDTDLLDPDFESGEDTDLGDPKPGTSTEVFFGGAIVGGEGGEFFESDLWISPTDGDVRLNTDNAVVGAEFPSSGFVDASDMNRAEFNTAPVVGGGTGFDVTWGRWSGSLTVDGVEDPDGGDGFVFLYTDPDNITPQGSLVGTRDYGTAFGPLALATDGGLWDVDFYDMNVDFGSNLVELFDFNLIQQNGTGSLSFPIQDTGTLDTASSSFEFNSLPFSGSANYTGAINGRFVGDNGQAVIIRFELEENSGGNTITGVQIVGPPS